MKAVIGGLCILIGLASSGECQSTSQNQTNVKTTLGSISGRVTIDGQAANDMSVMLATFDQNANSKLVASAKTDPEGRFHLADIPAGRYVIRGFAPAYTGNSSGLPITLSDGQTLEGIEIALVPGGVITGRLLDADNQPVVGAPVEAVRAENDGGWDWGYRPYFFASDDRGVYRIYGLAPGRYIVHAGIDIANTSGLSQRKFLPVTFHPGVPDRNKAAIVRVESGSEATGIDIVFGQPKILFEARGRVIEAETGRPVATARIGYGRISENSSSWSFVGISDAEGGFKISGLGPGRFYVSAEVEGANSYCVPAQFEIKEGDVSDIRVRLQRGATIGGVVEAGEGVDRNTFSKLQIWAIGSVSRGDQSGHSGSSRTVPISPEGVFQVTGLPAGETRILLLLPKDLPGIVISRIDHPMVQMAVREGREPEGAVTLQPGDQISGIRIILKRLAGGIRGAIKLAGGNLSPGAYLNVTLWRPSGAPGSESGTEVEVDGNGRFYIRGLAAGEYRLTAQILVRNQSGPPDSRMRAEKRFTIGDSVEEIEMEIDVRKRDQ